MIKWTSLGSRCSNLLTKTIGFMLIFVTMNSTFSNASDQSKSIPVQVQSACQLKFGWVIWPPYQYYDHRDQIVGLQIDLFNEIAAAADCSFEYTSGSWQEIQQGIRDGNIDLTGDATNTWDRNLYAYFSKSYREETLALYVKKNKLSDFPEKDIHQLIKRGFKVAVTEGNYYGEDIDSLANDSQFAAQFIMFDHTYQGYHALEKGLVDGLLDDPKVFSFSARLLGYEKKFVPQQVVVEKAKVALMFSRKTVSRSLVERFNQAISNISKSESN